MATIEEAEKWIRDHTRCTLIMCPVCGRLPEWEFNGCLGIYSLVCPGCRDRAQGSSPDEAHRAWNSGISAEYVKEQLEREE